jgi:hypothetical protein
MRVSTLKFSKIAVALWRAHSASKQIVSFVTPLCEDIDPCSNNAKIEKIMQNVENDVIRTCVHKISLYSVTVRAPQCTIKRQFLPINCRRRRF